MHRDLHRRRGLLDIPLGDVLERPDGDDHHDAVLVAEVLESNDSCDRSLIEALVREDDR